MNRYSVYFSAALAFALLLADASFSQAGIFGRWRTRYYQPYYPAATATVQPAPAATPAPAQAAAAPGAPVRYTVAKPVVSENAAPAPAPVQPSAVYAPQYGAATGAGWSVTPRSSWDFGSYPPYSH